MFNKRLVKIVNKFSAVLLITALISIHILSALSAEDVFAWNNNGSDSEISPEASAEIKEEDDEEEESEASNVEEVLADNQELVEEEAEAKSDEINADETEDSEEPDEKIDEVINEEIEEVISEEEIAEENASKEGTDEETEVETREEEISEGTDKTKDASTAPAVRSLKAPAGTRAAASYITALTDRSNDIGVPYEGYSDSPYTVYREVWAASQLNPRDAEKTVGGTYLLRPTDGLGVRHDYTDLDEQYWDGKMPFLIAPTAGNEGHKLVFRLYNDFALEDDNGVAPNGAMKIENLALEIRQIVSSPKMNFFARGNKFVMGEGITTQAATSLGNRISWRMYGGFEHEPIIGSSRPVLVTNVVLADGNWDYVYGGGEVATGTGTQVTIRGNANVSNVYGGGEKRGSVGDSEPAVNGDKGNPNNPGINVYIEDGQVGTLYGGCAINEKSILSGTYPLEINEDIRINVSGGHVDRIFAGSDTHDDNGESSGVQPVAYTAMGDCEIHGDATVNLSAPGAADVVVGDINRNLPRAATAVRQVIGATTLNITADQELEYAELFDHVNVDGASVKLKNDAGFRTFDSDYSSTEGYIGQIAVTNGGRLELGGRAIINERYAHYGTNGQWDYNWTEKDNSHKATSNHSAVSLRHGWVGEASEADRAGSVIAIDGEAAGITAANGTSFNDSRDICGLLIHGSVGSDSGWSMQGAAGNPGYSTLEVLGDPIYSSGDDYYYYIVADGSASNVTGTISKVPTSVNGGAAFKEPEGADYVVCYRHLDGGKIGWYLRERPTISAVNKLVHVGESGSSANMNAHIDLNGYAYEWSDTAASNNIGIKVTRYTGSASVTNTDILNITKTEMAGIANDTRFSSIVYDTSGYLESFDVLIDNSPPADAAYYKIDVIFDSDDAAAVGTGDGARCVYDFVSTGSAADPDYQDSIMTTSPHDITPQGADKAKLTVSLPYGCEAASLSISEDDGSFCMTDTDSGAAVSATLAAADTIRQNYEIADGQTANSTFGIEIAGDDLYDGITKTNLSGTSEYLCAVLSYKKLTEYLISNVLSSVVARDAADGISGHIGEVSGTGSSDGLTINLSLSSISRNGEAVGRGNPGDVNYGELRIRTAPLEDTVVPPITGMHETERSLEAVFIMLSMLFATLIAYMGLKKKWRKKYAGR